MNIIININKKYIMQACTLLCSILKNNSGEITLFVIHSELQKRDFDFFNRIINKFGADRSSVVDMKICDSVAQNFYSKDGRWPIEVYYRLFAPFLLSNLDRVLYLDSDMVIDGSLEPLYELEMGNDMVACVTDDVIQKKGEFYGRLGLSAEHIYVNSGMILFNIKKILEKFTIEDVLRIIRENQENLLYPDQDVLNIMYTKYILTVDYRYNWICIPKRNNPTKDIVIYHFGGEKEYKPWNSIYIGKFGDVFWKYAISVYTSGSRSTIVTKCYGQIYHTAKVFRRYVKDSLLKTIDKIRN